MKTSRIQEFILLAIAALIVLSYFLTPNVAFAGNGPRPLTEAALLLKLNGVPIRPLLADGGGLGIYVLDGGSSCADVDGGEVYSWTCDVPANICPSGGPGEMSDGGACSGAFTSPLYGWPQASSQTVWMVMQPTTKHICGHPQDGGTLNCPFFIMK